MKKLLYSSLLLSTVLYANNTLYKGCGIDESQARLNLANNISTKIESTTFLEKSSSSIFGIDMLSKSFKKNSKQSTNLTLKDINIIKEDKKTCATISKTKLLELTKELVSQVLQYNESSLPRYEKDKVIKISDYLTDIKNTIVLVGVFKTNFPNNSLDRLHKKEKLFINLRSKYNSQFAKITIIGKYDNLKIDNNSVKQNKEQFLKAGIHKYNIKSKNHCLVEGEFELKKNQDFETVINMNDYNYPYIIINSNKKNAKFTLDNEQKKLEKKYTINTCDNSELPYSVSYEGQVENGILKLSANSKVEEDFTFYSRSELSEFSKLAKSYDNTTRLEVKYGYLPISSLEDYENYEDINSLQLNLITSYKALRYGYGAVYGQADNSYIYELYYNLGLQLTSLSQNSALRVGSIVIVPSITAQAGFGKHKLYNTITQEFKSDKFNELNEENFKDDYLVLKAQFGLDFVLNENIGLNIFAQKQFTMEESLTFGAGVSLSF